MKTSTFSLALAFALAAPAVAKPLQTIAFGSCAKQYLPQPIWDSVIKAKPDVFIFLGDNIYGDTTDMGKLYNKYQQLGMVSGYQRLKGYCPVLATWDDHDYGKNDAGAEFTKKKESQKVFLDFFGEPMDSQRRKTPGIYDSKIFGKPGNRTQILLLDTRYFRGKLHRPGKPKLAIEGRTGPYLPNEDKSVPLLGEAQWEWLEAQLRKPAELRILCTSIQLISDQHGWECWANLPHERERLYALIRKTKANGIITISGDRHHGEITMDPATLPYPLYDVTASGMNTKSRFANEHNPKRLGSPYREEHFGTVLVDWETGTVTLQILRFEKPAHHPSPDEPPKTPIPNELMTAPKPLSLLPIAAILASATLLSAQPKGFNYDESKVPCHPLPDPLNTEDGKKVTDAKTWEEVRRPETFALFQEHVYGVSPAAPCNLQFEVFDDTKTKKFHRKQVNVKLSTKGHAMDLLLYLPAKVKGPVPTFLTLNFRGNHSITNDPDVRITKSWVNNDKGIKDNQASEATRGARKNRWDIEQILSRGYGIATIYCGDIEPDHRNGRPDGVRAAYPDTYTWSAIGAWAWGLARGLDYLETDKDVDAKKVIVMGHSRLGKTALWAGASDERFAITISNNSGCGGAAISRRKFGETVKRINTSFPNWFVDKYSDYNDNEEACPVDQHQLAALIAPRPLYIASAIDDRWADPKGEFLAAYHAAPVYKLLGAGDFPATEQPPLDKPVQGAIGYHIRTGKHDVTPFDWTAYLDFADMHFGK